MNQCNSFGCAIYCWYQISRLNHFKITYRQELTSRRSTRYDTIRYGMIWYGMIYDMIWASTNYMIWYNKLYDMITTHTARKFKTTYCQSWAVQHVIEQKFNYVTNKQIIHPIIYIVWDVYLKSKTSRFHNQLQGRYNMAGCFERPARLLGVLEYLPLCILVSMAQLCLFSSKCYSTLLRCTALISTIANCSYTVEHSLLTCMLCSVYSLSTGILRLPWLRFFRAFSSVVRQMPGYTSQRRGTVHNLSN
jgi:hypothetical protein